MSKSQEIARIRNWNKFKLKGMLKQLELIGETTNYMYPEEMRRVGLAHAEIKRLLSGYSSNTKTILKRHKNFVKKFNLEE